MLVASDPDDETGERRVLGSTKHNLSKEAASLSYRLESVEDDIVRVVWLGAQTAHSVESLLAPRDSADEHSALVDACGVLDEILSNGALPAKEVYARAADAGISEKTLDRAKKRRKVRSIKTASGWIWQPSIQGSQGTQESQESQQSQESQHGPIEDDIPL